MLQWLFRFLICALVLVVVIYVCNMFVGMIVLPEPARMILLLIIAVACLLAALRYLGMPPAEGP